MQYIKSIILLFTIVASTFTGDKALGQVPDDRTVQFEIRYDPSDPFSDVIYTILLEISAIEVIEKSVGWEITNVSIHRLNKFQQPISIRNDQFPFISTNDGLWWIEHVDPVWPQAEEFVMPPTIVGYAVSSDPNVDNLEYNLTSVEYKESLEGSLFDVTASLNYSLNSASEEEGGDNEPVRMPSGSNGPLNTE